MDSAYDNDGHISTVTDGSNVSTYGYDAAGKPTSLVRPNGTSTAWTYDRVGRTATITHKKSSTPFASYSYTYDNVGNPTAVSAPEGNITYGYDSQDRLTDACYDPTCAADFLHYTYDGVGNRLNEVRSKSDVVKRRATATNVTQLFSTPALFSISKPAGTQQGDLMLLHMAMTGGNVATYSMSTSGWHVVDDHTAGQTRGVVLYKVATTSEPSSYTATFNHPVGVAGGIASYIGVDDIAPIDDSSASQATAATSLTLPSVNASVGGRVVAVTASNDTAAHPAQSGQEWFQAAGTNPGSTASLATFEMRTTVGPTGPRPTSTSSLNENWVGSLIALRPAAGTTTYAYNGDDELTSATNPIATTNYTYDAAGNETAAGSRTLTYDLAGRTSQIADPGSTANYTYDGDGKRLSATQGSTTTNFTWDPNGPLPQLLEEATGAGALIRRYDYGYAPLSEETPSTTSWYNADAIGSVTSVTDPSGNIGWSYTYDPFGAQRSASQLNAGVAAQPMGFVGQYLDSTGLHYLRARQYDGILGRFTARDPLRPFRSSPLFGSYVYAFDTPESLVDPSGRRGQGPAGPMGPVGPSVSPEPTPFPDDPPPDQTFLKSNCAGETVSTVPAAVRGSVDIFGQHAARLSVDYNLNSVFRFCEKSWSVESFEVTLEPSDSRSTVDTFLSIWLRDASYIPMHWTTVKGWGKTVTFPNPQSAGDFSYEQFGCPVGWSARLRGQWQYQDVDRGGTDVNGSADVPKAIRFVGCS